MPAFLLVAWPYIKQFGPYLLIALFCGWIVFHFEGVGERKQAAKDTTTIAKWEVAFHASDANFDTAIGMVNSQNAAIKALQADGQQRAREAAAARDVALKANASLVQQNATLAQVAKRHYSASEPCTTPPEVMKGAQI